MSGKTQQISKDERDKIETLHRWLRESLPALCLEDLQDETIWIMAHYLRSFPHLDFPGYLSTEQGLFAFSFGSPSSYLAVIKQLQHRTITHFRTFRSTTPLPFSEEKSLLHVIRISFHPETVTAPLPCSIEENRYHYTCSVDQKNKQATLNLSWNSIENPGVFLYSLLNRIFHLQLPLLSMNALSIDTEEHPLLLSLSLSTEGVDLEECIQELLTLPYFPLSEEIHRIFLSSGLVSGIEAPLIPALCSFIHQTLAPFDVIKYSFSYIEEILFHYPTLVVLLLRAFHDKFHPQDNDLSQSDAFLQKLKEQIEEISSKLEAYDLQHKTILYQAVYFVESCIKTNFYERHKTALCFRLHPTFLQKTAHLSVDKFPELPFAIYFLQGLHFIGFHIRFKDLARGGLRTVIPRSQEEMILERTNIFSECYHLAYTQQKKNKDIPEGGSKGVIFLETVPTAHNKLSLLYAAQRSYIQNLLTLVNCEEDGTLKTRSIIDYWKKPEYLYLGPDENMHNSMIDEIAAYSVHEGYKPGAAFISSKPDFGINHKEFGVTSLGINVCMDAILRYIGIDPTKDTFTLKMTGGPDGDVAGNQMLNLLRYYPKTAKLLTTIDISGVIFDPEGIDLQELQKLFLAEKPIGDYPPKKLSERGFLADTRTQIEPGTALCHKKEQGHLTKELLSPHETMHILRHTIHKTTADVFIPAGGRPKTLQENNISDFLREGGKPTVKAIIEGANLYLTNEARKILEHLGVLILKDSSANKGGVICSSFEVLVNLCLTQEEFLVEKAFIVEEILAVIAKKAQEEVQFLLAAHETSATPLTELSEELSQTINAWTDTILYCLEEWNPLKDPNSILINILLDYCLPTLRHKYVDRILTKVPDIHKKAMIACHLAAHLVYHKQHKTPPKNLSLEELLLLL